MSGSDDNIVPDGVKSFVRFLNKSILKKNVHDIQSLYEQDLVKLTERHFKQTHWPSAEAIAPLVDSDENFVSIYKELYFRHVHSKLRPTVEDRFDSFQNYVNLFNIILGLTTESPELELPSAWLWDIVDEFISQFQEFHRFRHNTKNLGAEDLQLLKDHEHVWSVQTVVRFLFDMVKKAELQRPGADEVKDDEKEVKERRPDDTNVSNMFKALGVFALVGLLRVNCLLADYTSALKALDPIDLVQKRGIFTRVVSCHITLYYNMGFAYVMSRRYLDAIKTISGFLLYINRNRNIVSRSSQSANIIKRLEQMHALLAIAISLYPQSLDDSLLGEIREKFGDKLQRMQKLEVTAFEETFSLSCPNFVNPRPPTYTSDAKSIDPTQAAYQLQLKIFLTEVKQRSSLPEIYANLRLCSTIKTSKLASLLNTDEEALSTQLLCLKHKTRNLRWRGGPPSRGEWVTSGEVDFHVAKDMIQVAQYQSTRRYGDYFIRHILRFEDIVEDLTRKPEPETVTKKPTKGGR